MKFDNIGVKVRVLRKERGLTQEKLAEMAEISINYLSKIENNRIKNVGVLITFRLAKALGVTSGYLMGQEDMNELLDEEILGRLAECSPADKKKILKIIDIIKQQDEIEYAENGMAAYFCLVLSNRFI